MSILCRFVYRAHRDQKTEVNALVLKSQQIISHPCSVCVLVIVVCCDIVCPRNDREATPMILEWYGCLNKAWTMTTSIDRLICGPTPRQSTIEKWWLNSFEKFSKKKAFSWLKTMTSVPLVIIYFVHMALTSPANYSSSLFFYLSLLTFAHLPYCYSLFIWAAFLNRTSFTFCLCFLCLMVHNS